MIIFIKLINKYYHIVTACVAQLDKASDTQTVGLIKVQTIN